VFYYMTSRVTFKLIHPFCESAAIMNTFRLNNAKQNVGSVRAEGTRHSTIDFSNSFEAVGGYLYL